MRLGFTFPLGGVIILTVGGALGLIGLTMSLFQPQPSGFNMAIAQYLFFGFMLIRGPRRWLMTDSGHLGPARLIRWADIAAYSWDQTGLLSLTTYSSKPLRLSISSQAREKVEAVLNDQLSNKLREGDQ